MASPEREHKKRLKEAEKTLIRMNKLRVQGKIGKEEFVQALRPYKDELIELGYPIRTKEGTKEEAVSEKENIEDRKQKERVGHRVDTDIRWRKRSTLTMDEIERSIDRFSTGKKPSGSLQRIFQERYGEELEPPEEGVTFTMGSDDGGDPPVEEELRAEEPEEDGTAGSEKKPFWKSMIPGKGKDK